VSRLCQMPSLSDSGSTYRRRICSSSWGKGFFLTLICSSVSTSNEPEDTSGVPLQLTFVHVG